MRHYRKIQLFLKKDSTKKERKTGPLMDIYRGSVSLSWSAR
jgi:hypothetical protein